MLALLHRNNNAAFIAHEQCGWKNFHVKRGRGRLSKMDTYLIDMPTCGGKMLAVRADFARGL
jgi:hypothetical protein